MRKKTPYAEFYKMVRKAGYDGLEGAGTNKQQWIRLVHPEKSITFEGRTFNACMKKAIGFLEKTEKNYADF